MRGETPHNRGHASVVGRVAFEVRDNGEAVLRPVTKSVDEVFGRLHRSGRAPQSVAQMKAAVAAKMKGRK